VVKEHFRIGLGRRNFPSVLDAFEAALPVVLQGMGVDAADCAQMFDCEGEREGEAAGCRLQ
jgi:hypothetical protein